MSGEAPGDTIPPKCAVLDVHVGESRRLFNATDPAPFRERDEGLLIGGWVAMWSPLEIFRRRKHAP